MATIVASRYAVLSVDDDDDDDDILSRKKKIPNKKPVVVKLKNSNTVKPDGNAKKKKKPENTQQSQNAKNRNKTSNAGGSSKKKKELVELTEPAEQWEEWKQKDAQFVEGNFKEDLSKAILLSKLDYEQNKDIYETVKVEEKKNSSRKNKKGQKVMSLSEFNNLGSESKKNESPPKSAKTEKDKKKSEFFNSLDKEIQKEISKEHLLEKKKESNSQESLTLVLYKASIEKRDREIAQLKAEIERLNLQLKNVKTRNTKLCQIIANGEMKDKAEVLMEVERLQTIKDELSSEVAELHIQLEQERSKVRQLSAEHRNKDKNKKHNANSGETQ